MTPVAVLTGEQIADIVRREVEPLRLELEKIRGVGGGELLPMPEAARRLGVSPRTVQRWVKSGSLEVVRIGGSRRVRLPGGSMAG
jgi:excisionase family DNA binding protein